MRIYKNIKELESVGQLSANSLVNADCLEAMKYIADKSIDCIIADLPYGQLRTTACKWDTIIPFEPLWAHYKRIIKDNGAIVLFGSQPFTSALVMSNPKWFKYCIYWEKEKPTNFMQLKRRFGKTVEDIAIFYINQPTYNPIMEKSNGRIVKSKPKGGAGDLAAKGCNNLTPYNDNGFRYPTQVVKMKKVTNGTMVHPTQKPIPLLEYLIKTYTNEGDTVLDNTFGSGTTCVAAKQLNRSFIGIEMDEKYFEIAVKRINEAQPHVSLFSDCQ